MRRALHLAALASWTSPNPRVGCVIVRDGVVIAEGYHQGSGTPHAEAVALSEVDARGSTLYCTLEPCSHVGKTPACAPAIVAAGVSKVVIATLDPDRRVDGTGMRILQDAEVEVEVGLLEAEARSLNAPYLRHRNTGKSFLTLKLALSLDGRLSAPDGSSQWITGASSRERVHLRRAEADAVMVGAGTVLADDPSLTARPISDRRQPLKVVVDGKGATPPDARLFDHPGQVLIFTSADAPHERQTAWKERGADVIALPATSGRVSGEEILSELGRRDVLEVICEGGGDLAASLVGDDLVDRLELYYGPVLLGAGGTAIGDLGVGGIEEAKRFRTQRVEQLGDDVLIVQERSA